MLKLIITKTKFKINRFLKKRQLSKQGVTIGTGSHFTGTHFEGHNYIGPHTCISHSEVGRYSYIGKNSSFDRALIGCFCSIGDDVKVIAAQHPTQGFVSTSPVFFDKSSHIGSFTKGVQLFPDYRFVPTSNYKGIIGNDVWIGSNCTIIGGVKIGTGAIIAASAVVSKDVEPFSIVGGVPAKFIRYRFKKEQIDTVIRSCWWNKSEDWLKDHLEEMKEIETFCKKIHNREVSVSHLNLITHEESIERLAHRQCGDRKQQDGQDPAAAIGGKFGSR